MEEWPKELLDEPRGILQNKTHSIFYINPELNLSVSVLGLNFYFLKAEKDNWHKQTTDRKGPGNTCKLKMLGTRTKISSLTVNCFWQKNLISTSGGNQLNLVSSQSFKCWRYVCIWQNQCCSPQRASVRREAPRSRNCTSPAFIPSACGRKSKMRSISPY